MWQLMSHSKSNKRVNYCKYSLSKCHLLTFTSKYKFLHGFTCLRTHGEHFLECLTYHCVKCFKSCFTRYIHLRTHVMQDTYQLKKMFLMSQLVKESGTFEVLWQVYMAPQIKEKINFLTNAWLRIEI